MTAPLTNLSGLLIVLGSTNTKKGILSPLAKSRAAKAYQFWTMHPHFKFLLTGGFGARFNQTDKAHGAYVRDYLIDLGVPSSAMLGVVESFNTIEDAFLSSIALEGIIIDHLVISTSDFHIQRARLIFENMFLGQKIEFLSSTPPVSERRRAQYEAHERFSIQRLLKADRLQVFNDR